MAPQRLSQISGASGNYIFGNDVFTTNPELAALVARAIAGWSLVETTLGNAFAEMIGPNQTAALKMYSSLRSFEIQRSLLESVADEKLPKRRAQVFRATIVVLCKYAGVRHKFAHWIWGRSTDTGLSTEALFLVEPHYFWTLRRAFIVHDRRTAKDPGPLKALMRPAISPENIWVWKRGDLLAACRDMERAGRIANELNGLVAKDSLVRRHIQRQLAAVPEVRLQLQRMNPTDKKRSRSSPKSPRKSSRTKRARPN